MGFHVGLSVSEPKKSEPLPILPPLSIKTAGGARRPRRIFEKFGRRGKCERGLALRVPFFGGFKKAKRNQKQTKWFMVRRKPKGKSCPFGGRKTKKKTISTILRVLGLSYKTTGSLAIWGWPKWNSWTWLTEVFVFAPVRAQKRVLFFEP